ncbi:MAG: hypothetical protein H6Q66_891 [Firmicutes bacterium]|nr:hypothetical protein [Bacillota bacterium]
MNTAKMNAAIGFVTVFAAGLLLYLQEDTKLMLPDVSSAWIAGFVFLSIVLGMIFWRNNNQRQNNSTMKTRTKMKKR